jgi:hypothetical protein
MVVDTGERVTYDGKLRVVELGGDTLRLAADKSHVIYGQNGGFRTVQDILLKFDCVQISQI